MKTLLLLTLICFATFEARSQVWIEENATWHYHYQGLLIKGFHEYIYEKDTLIDDQPCQKIIGTEYRYTDEEDPILLSSFALSNQYTYVSEDTVFYYNDGQFFTMLNFGADVGDSWAIATTPFDVCSDTSYVIVTETGSMTIDGMTYRTITLEPESNSSYGYAGTFVERFGNVSGSGLFHYPFPYEGYQCDSTSGAYEWAYFKFVCFEDDLFDLYNPSGAYCAYYLGDDEVEKKSFSVGPNPTNGLLTVNGLTAGDTYSIYDLTGKLLLMQQWEGSVINLSSMANGTYLIQFAQHTERLIIQH